MTSECMESTSVKHLLMSICQNLDLNIELRDFQITFFERVLSGVSGFLRVGKFTLNDESGLSCFRRRVVLVKVSYINYSLFSYREPGMIEGLIEGVSTSRSRFKEIILGFVKSNLQ